MLRPCNVIGDDISVVLQHRVFAWFFLLVRTTGSMSDYL